MAIYPTQQPSQKPAIILLFSISFLFLKPNFQDLLFCCCTALSAFELIMYQSRAWWLSRIICGIRTIIACTIVASATLYSPTKIHPFPTYPSISYVIAILVVPQRTLGDTLGSFWQIIYATAQVMPVSILSLKVMKPGEISYAKAAVTIAMFSFMVGLPKSSTLLTKRIALVEIVIFYAGAVIRGKSTGVIMHPVHVGASALLGAVASVIALLLPFPMLAYSEVKKECSLYAENASMRLNLLVKAFCAENQQAATDLLLQTSTVSKSGSKLVQSIKLKQEGMALERAMVRFMKPSTVKPGGRLENIEVLLRGMEMAMNWRKSPKMINQGIIDAVKNMEEHVDIKLQQVRFLMPFDATTAPENKVETPRQPLINLASISPTIKDLPVFFIIFCLRLLQDDFPVCSNFKDLKCQKPEKGEDELSEASSGVCKRLAGALDLIFALKCSFSLGIAVFLGLHYAKENAFWSGLTIAISFVTARQPAFNVANARAQGTAFGSLYGVLGCYIVKNHKTRRFLLLFPWILLVSFLRRSRMFGEAWGISAAIGGLLILGRNNYHQPPDVFAITRIAEAVIGLSCFILVELLLQPTRASTLAKIEVSNCLHSFQQCVQEIKLCPLESPVSSLPAVALRQKQNTLKVHVEELQRFIEEADIEPNFWFLPFSSSVYQKLLNSFAKTVDLLSFIACLSETFSHISQRSEASPWMEFQELVDEDLKLCGDKLCSSLRGLEDVMSIKSVAELENALKTKAAQTDIESGKPAKYDFTLLCDDRGQMDSIVKSLIGHSVESIREIHSAEGDEKIQSQTKLCLGTLGFCIRSLMQEVIVMETEIKELIRWENPTVLVDLHKISGKVNCLKQSTKAGYMSAADCMTSISIDRPFLGNIMW